MTTSRRRRPALAAQHAGRLLRGRGEPRREADAPLSAAGAANVAGGREGSICEAAPSSGARGV